MRAIKNLSKQVLLLRLNSGAEVNVAPGGQLDQVAESEIRDNRTIKKLFDLGLIALPEVKPAKPAGAEEATHAAGHRSKK